MDFQTFAPADSKSVDPGATGWSPQ